MGVWNRLAIEHWISLLLDEEEALYKDTPYILKSDRNERRKTAFGYYLGYAVVRNTIPLERAVASGHLIYVPYHYHSEGDDEEYYDENLELDVWFYDVSARIKSIESRGRKDHRTGERIPSALEYPFPFRVNIDPICRTIQRRDYEDVIFPSTGIYIYFHPYEGYKIGQAENISRRMDKHWCSAPAAKLLHVIETNDLDWCEKFIHDRFYRWRRHSNHEYFDLTSEHLAWLFGIEVLNKPKTLVDQHSLLDLL